MPSRGNGTHATWARKLAISVEIAWLCASSAAAAPPPAKPPEGFVEALARREYEATPNARGLQAPNRAHDLRTYFDARGIRVHDRTAPGDPGLLSLTLSRVGRGDALTAVAPGEVTHAGARVEIRRTALTEWYVNSDAGLEQGFTLAERPQGKGALALELALDDATASQQGSDLVFATRAGRRLRYGALRASDAAGRALPARFELVAGDRVRIAVDDAGAAYPVAIDPLLKSSPDAVLLSAQGGSQLGYSVASAGDVNGDGYADVIVGAPFYDHGQTDEGAAFIFLGSATGITSGTPASADTVLASNQANAWFGTSVASAGDVNGDGYADVIVGASMYDDGHAAAGAAFVFLGSASGVASGGPGTGVAALTSAQANAQLGFSVASAGDVNGDGYADVIVGAPYYDSAHTDEGAAFIFLGGAAGVSSGTPASAATTLRSDQDVATFGFSVASAGDVNGDGYDDVIVAAPVYDNGDPNEGAAFVFLGSASGVASATPASAATMFESNQGFAGQVGMSVASAGDANGDGYADVIIGVSRFSHGEVDEGCAFVLYGSASGIASGNPGSPGVTLLESDQASSEFGNGVASAGDVNGDGYADVIVGARLYDDPETDEGAAFVFLGGPSGVANGSPATAYARLEIDQSQAFLGFNSVASAGDVNGDGYADVIVGVPGYDGGDSNEGAALVYLGGAQGIVSGNPASAGARLTSDQSFSGLGARVASAGDVNGDGFADVIVGAPGYDLGAASGGAAFIFLGHASGIADAVPTSAATRLGSSQADSQFGYSVASAGDVNGDGYDDVMVGAWLYDDGEPDEGAVFVFLGGPSGIASGDETTAATRIESDTQYAYLGQEIASAGDVNGDGFGDVILGVPEFELDEDVPVEGAAWIFLGSPTGIASGNLASAATLLRGNLEESGFGIDVACAGDVNGDGYADVIVGAQDYYGGGNGVGAAFVFHGSAAGIASEGAESADTWLESDQGDSGFGYSVASAGDVNGDGYADVIVGHYGRDAGFGQLDGGAFVYLGSASGVASGTPASAATQILSDQANAYFGLRVAGAGDVNGDGYADVIVGARLYEVGQAAEGAAFVYLGSASGIPSGTAATASARLESDDAGAQMGSSVAGAGDVNGDGFADVIVGAPGYDVPAQGAGAAFVFYGDGNHTGRPGLPRQRSSSGGLVRPWGSSYTSGFQVKLIAIDSTGRGRVKLQVESCPAGVPFGHASCSTSNSPSWFDVTASPGGVSLAQNVTGVPDDTLRRWRVRVLYAPYSVTKPGITEPPNPAHGPWRRLAGQVNEADLRVRLDTDHDGIPNSVDPDDDNDGLSDVDEATYGTNPLDPDSDDDGLLDGAEVAIGTNPLDPDTDSDGVCDGPLQQIFCLSAGPDNCPFVLNPSQQNSDGFAAGDACQCGDVTGDGVLDEADLTRVREQLVGRTTATPFDPDRCDVTGDGLCDVRDLAVLERLVRGAPAMLVPGCAAYHHP